MLRIPFDGPNLEGRKAVVTTSMQRLQGIVVTLSRDMVELAVDGSVVVIPATDVQVISPA